MKMPPPIATKFTKLVLTILAITILGIILSFISQDHTLLMLSAGVAVAGGVKIIDYLKNDADEVIYFAGVEAAKVYLREHGVTEDEMEDMVFRKSVGTCFRCGDPLFLSDIPEYTCQCFRCDEDFYSIEQDVDL